MNLEHKAGPKPVPYQSSKSGHRPTSYKAYGDRIFKFASDLRDLIRTTTWGADITPKQYVNHMANLLSKISNEISYADALDTGHYRLIDEAISYGEGPNRNTVGHNIQKVIDDSVKYLRSIESATRAQHFAENQNGSELEHYGRLGMKWGMHIFGEEKTYRKSMDKLSSLDKKTRKSASKAGKYFGKGDVLKTQSELAINPIKKRRKLKQANRAYKKLHRAVSKNVKYNRRAAKLVKAMNSEFANKKISSFTDEDISLGEKYSVELINRNRNQRINSSNVITTSWGETAIVDFSRRDK